MSDYKYLVFGGGGAAGYAYAGVFEELERQAAFSQEDIKGVAGTSVGAIAALVVALNYTAKEASQLLTDLDLHKMADGGWYYSQLYRLFNNYGRYRGDELYNFIKKLIQAKIGNKPPELITFADLHAFGFKDLVVVATKLYKINDVPTGKQKIFSFEKTPDTSVADAIRASAAAPTYFPRVRLKKIVKGKYVLASDGDMYEDGGVINNFAIDMFDKPKYLGLPDDGETTMINPFTLGFALLEVEDIQDKSRRGIKTPLQDGHPFQYVIGLFNTLFNQINNEKLNDEKNRERTVQIDRKGVKLADFDMSATTKLALIASGRDAVRSYFNNLTKQHNLVTLTKRESSNEGIFAPSFKFGT